MYNYTSRLFIMTICVPVVDYGFKQLMLPLQGRLCIQFLQSAVFFLKATKYNVHVDCLFQLCVPFANDESSAWTLTVSTVFITHD